MDSKRAPDVAAAAAATPAAPRPGTAIPDRKDGASPSQLLIPASVSSLLGRASERRMYQGLRDTRVTCDAALPDSVMIEGCERVELTLTNKVANVKVSGCTDVVVRFPAVLTTIELINSTRCDAVCTRTCRTFAVDGCAECRVHLQASGADEVFIVAAQSRATRAFAWAEGSAVDLAGAGAAASSILPDNEPAVPPNVPQTIVKWDGRAFGEARVGGRVQGYLKL